MKKEILHSREINIEDEADGVWLYLKNHLSLDEFETLFNHAKFYDKAYFQDRQGKHYQIEYENGEYFVLEK